MKSERPAGRGGSGGWVFLMVVLVIYAVTALVDYELIFPHDFGHGVKLPAQITSVSDVR